MTAPHEIAGYRIERKLGEGGMGQVFVATHPQLGYRVAVKVLLPEYTRNPEIVARFFNEARAASRLQHPGIARVFDFGHAADGAAFFTMELLAGEALASRLARRRLLTVAEALTITRQIATALAAAHADGIVHRDIKPDNVFLVPDPDVVGGERAKLLDFGIAKLMHDGGDLVRTRTGAVMGTPYYMSPEQCRGAAELDARTDVYAVGCVLFEMLCGRPPFLGEGVGEILAAHQHVPLPDPRSLNPQLSEAVVAIIRDATAKDPRARLPAMTALAARCQAARDQLGGGPAPEPAAAPFTTTLSSATGAPTQTTAPRRWPWLAIGGGAVVIAGGLLAMRGREGGEGRAAAPPPPPPDAATLPDGWALIEPATPAVRLGVDADAGDAPGFRPARAILSPDEPFLIQQREATWRELAAIGATAPAGVDPGAAAAGIAWTDADRYCRGLGGSLPSEEQWELAARGAARRPHPWGDQQLDLAQVHAFAGADAAPQAPGGSAQDRTPARAGRVIYDLAGNAQEWTRDLWREDAPGQDEAWVQADGVTYRAVRGLPLRAAPPSTPPRASATYREPLCASGPCPDDTAALLRGVGVRCVKPWP
ncbi:MAG: protein kinase [Myxococcales bacterium]|nr:protein kinase [Myxococcales bacterium]